MSNQTTARHARLFRNGRNQALRIPREFERPVKKPGGLADLLASWGPLEEEFPDVDEGLLPLDNIKL